MATKRNIVFSLSAILLAPAALAAWQTPGQSTAQMAAAAQTAPGITATVSEPFYKITAEDVGKAVAEQLQLQAVAPHAQAILTPGTPPLIYAADHALQVAIHALQIDPDTKRWQGQAYILANGQTEIVKPVSGTYDVLVDVPVLIHQLRTHDVIAQSDIAMRPMPQRQLRKDTVTDAATLIGQSPRSAISAERPIRATEVTAPVVIKKGDAVELSFQTKYMSIKTTGVALEDGAVGAAIRVKNEKSEKAVSGRVASAGHVEVNPSL